ncbi:unnamed protein product [Protopolystoma xenopodis]|uniref:Uncharacterized protein n=1 Tax=Protopolystoma xenopodis TaxID=117903 RepID=A0A448WGN8_9PLAT|nr:unnamed protein product [Protopolystoma xenopodis]
MNWAYNLPFTIYYFIVGVILITITFAIIWNHYRDNCKKEVRSSIIRKRQLLAIAFDHALAWQYEQEERLLTSPLNSTGVTPETVGTGLCKFCLPNGFLGRPESPSLSCNSDITQPFSWFCLYTSHCCNSRRQVKTDQSRQFQDCSQEIRVMQVRRQRMKRSTWVKLLHRLKPGNWSDCHANLLFELLAGPKSSQLCM